MREKFIQFINKYEVLSTKYNDEEIEKAYKILEDFFKKISSLKINENGIFRPLNQLEEFIIIYEFVSNKIYRETDKSNDIIGVLIGEYAVCQGFTQLMEFICEIRNIPFLYIHTESLDENGLFLGSHGNFQVIINYDNVNYCLHCDCAIDCPKDVNDFLTYNSFLISMDQINNYYHTQIPSGSDNIANLLWKITVDKTSVDTLKEEMNKPKFIDTFLGLSEKESINKRYLELHLSIVELSKFLKVNISDYQNNESVLLEYQQLLNRYNELSSTIDREKLYNFIKELYSKLFNSKIIDNQIQQRINSTCEKQKKYWDSSCKRDF